MKFGYFASVLALLFLTVAQAHASRGSLPFTQKLDHFNDQDDRTFTQRYYINSIFQREDHSPVILYVCGEQSCNEPQLIAVINMARLFMAPIVTVEHRYFGKSQPFDDLSTKNLKYLTMSQAIEDLRSVRKSLMQSPKLDGPWIVVGGSYAGMLAAFLRTKAPDEFQAAWASSAPVLTTREFPDADLSAAKTLSPSCFQKVKTVQKLAGKALITNRAETLKLFGLEKATKNKDALYVIADAIAYAVMTGMEKRFCKELEPAAESELLQVYAKLSIGTFLLATGSSPAYNSFQSSKDISLDTHGIRIGMRQWLYLSCNELGQFQVAASSDSQSLRSPKLGLSFFQNSCRRLFGKKFRQKDLQKTWSAFVTPMLSQGSQIFFTNGENDPYSRISVDPRFVSIPSNLKSEVVEGGSHCSDLNASNEASDHRPKDVAYTVINTIKNWVGL